MKTRIILLLILIAIIALVIVNLLPDNPVAPPSQKTEDRNYQTLLLEEVELNGEQTVEGKLVPALTKRVRFEVGGILEKGDVPLVVGRDFKFNQLLVKVNMYEIFGQLSELKGSLEQTLDGLIPAMNVRFPGEVNKWKDFLKDLDPGKRLPAFPLLVSKEEGDLLRTTTFLKEYVKASKLEDEVEKYFYLAPFDGTVVSVSKRAGSNVKPGETVAVIAKKGAFNVQIDAALYSDLKRNGRIDFLDNQGKVVGSGKFSLLQGAKALYSISLKGDRPEDGKVYLKIRNGVNCFRIPASSVKDSKVRILSGETVSEREITILQEAGDSVFVNGLKEGEILIVR